MNKITLPQAPGLTSPNPLTLICTRKEDGNTNLATVSWWTYLSFKPAMIGFAMSGKSFSGERIRETGKVTLAIPGESLSETVRKCGSCSGRNVDKAAETGVELQLPPDSGNRIPVPSHSRVVIECTLQQTVTVGDHYLYICSADQVFANEEEKALFAWKGYAEIRTV